LNGSVVLARVLARLLFEQLDEVINDSIVEIFAT
jgi:hypothetical protein